MKRPTTPYQLVLSILNDYYEEQRSREARFLMIWEGCSFNKISDDNIILSQDNITYFHIQYNLGTIHYSYAQVLYHFDMNYNMTQHELEIFIIETVSKYFGITGLKPVAC